MSTFSIKEGDTLPVLEVALLDPDGSAHDLTGVTSVKLIVRSSPTTTFEKTMTVHDAEAGLVRYAWQPTDWTDSSILNVEAGLSRELEMEYEVVSGSNKMTFPTNGYDTLHIRGDLG